MRITGEQLVFGGWGLILLIGFGAMKVDPFVTDWNRAWQLWIVLTLIGFGLMVLTMNLRQRTMQLIFANWVIVVGLGLGITVALTQAGHFELYPYMGAIWLGVIGLGHLGTTLVGGPGACRTLGVIELAVAVLMAALHDQPWLQEWQFVITGLVAAASQFSLLVPRPVLRRVRV